MDIVVHQDAIGAAQEPHYMQVLGHDDGICVAFIGQTWPDGRQRGWCWKSASQPYIGLACNISSSQPP